MTDYEKLIAERDTALIRVQELRAEVRNLQAERIAVVADYRRVHALNESLLNETARLKSRLASAQERWLEEQAKLEEELRVVLTSKSWRLTAPLRALFRAIR